MARLARDALPVAAVALVVFQGLRSWVADRYLVPSDSMQPTFFGDRDRGDVVLVDKLSGVGGLRVHDLVVLHNPTDPERLLVKRVAALGDDPEACYLALAEGDLWLGPDPQHLRRDRKHPLQDRDLRITWFEYPPKQPGDSIEHFLGPPGAWDAPVLVGIDATDAELLRTAAAVRGRAGAALYPDGWLGTVRPVETSFVDAYGNRRRDGEVVVSDCGVELQLADSERLDGLLLSLYQRPDHYAWAVRERVQFYRNGEPVGEPLPRPARLDRVEFGFLDGSFFLVVDGQLVDWRERPASWLSLDPPTARPAPKNLLAFCGLGRGTARVLRTRVFRDLWYVRDRAYDQQPMPLLVPPGHAFLLGDNSFDSDDSRQHGPIPLAGYVGRPRVVLGPYPRFVWLRR